MKFTGFHILLLLVIVTVIWIVLGVYFNNTELDIDPNATSYMQIINSNFEQQGLDDMYTRVEENLPVSPSELLNMTKVEN